MMGSMAVDPTRNQSSLRLKASPWLIAIVAGFAWACAFPKFNIAGLAWITPALLLWSARAEPKGRSFRVGYIGGLVFWLTTLHWLLLIPYRWHGIPFGPALGWFLLSAFLALYPATWTWLCIRLSTSSNAAVPAPGWLWRSLFAIECAALWVGLEMLQARLLSGFPWELLGVSQHKLVPLIQIASVTGVYGVSFLIVWFSVSLLTAIEGLLRQPNRRAWIADIVLPVAAIAAAWFWGSERISAPAEEPRRNVKLALIQPSIPQEVIWDADAAPQRFEKLFTLSKQALLEKPDVLVWPEASMPGLSRENITTMVDLVASNHVWFIFGADDADFSATATNYFNSAFLFSPDGQYVTTYHKRLLVMFGEYVPLVRWFPFLSFFTPIEGGFTPGGGPVAFNLQNLPAKTSVLICFEDVFPHFAREHVQDGINFLLNLTNDGWFGNSAAQWQHAITAIFRAVENGVPLVRCTNNGITCWADEFGRMQQVAGRSGAQVYEPGYLIADIPATENRQPTFYTRHGDWFGWGCVVLALAAVLRASVRAKPSTSQERSAAVDGPSAKS